MNTAYFYLTDEGGKLAHKLATAHPGDIYNKENFKENLRAGFGKYDSLVCIMATGIVVRILAFPVSSFSIMLSAYRERIYMTG